MHPDDCFDEFYTGDARRCPRHDTVISSPDGMFDAPCGACEAEMDAAYEAGYFSPFEPEPAPSYPPAPPRPETAEDFDILF